MKVIEFAKDYRKLHCRVGDIFTTIRRGNDMNNKLYLYSQGEVFHVKIEGKEAFKAKLLYCDTFADGLGDNFSVGLLEYDSDGDVGSLYARYQSDGVLLLIFQKMGESE
jgi:hypothetical protein